MIEWVRALSPIIVAVLPILAAVFTTAKKTRNDTCKKIEEVRRKLDAHVTADEWAEQKARRLRILRCAYEITSGNDYSAEYLGEVVADCDDYSIYCDQHPDYKNSKGHIAMRIVRDEYMRKLKKEVKNNGVFDE